MSSPAWPTLVLVEGLPGSGKSTTAQWLADQMQAQGRAARWVYEQEVPHPVLGPTPAPTGSWKEFLGHRLAGWARFVAAVQTSATATVVESTFLQASAMAMLWRGLDPDTVLAFVDRVADLVRPLDPALVHFVEPDPDAAFRRTCDARGMAWTLHHLAAFEGSEWARAQRRGGMDGLLAYWREHEAICVAAVPRVGLRTLRVGPDTGDWAARRRRIAEFLGLAWPPAAPLVVSDLAPFVGSYRREAGREARLSMREGVLALDGLLWSATRLLPRAARVFDTESWPFRLTFDVDADGGVPRFRLEGPDLPMARLVGLYERSA